MTEPKENKKKELRQWLPEFEFAKIKQRLEETILRKTPEEVGKILRPKREKSSANDYDFGEAVYGHLGVCGGAYVIADKSRNQLISFYNPDLQSELAGEYRKVPFLEIPYRYYDYDAEYSDHSEATQKAKNQAEKYYDVIDAIYIGAQDRQELFPKDGRPSPDFYLNLPHLAEPEFLKQRLPFERYLSQKDFEIIYCTVGEVLFFLFTWRMLVRCAQTRGLTESGSVINRSEEYIDYQGNFPFWEEIANVWHARLPEVNWLADLSRVQFKNRNIKNTWEGLVREIDEEPMASDYDSYHEFERMGFVEKKGGDLTPTRDLLSLVRYALFIAETILRWRPFDPDRNYKIKKKKGGKPAREIADVRALSKLLELERCLDQYFHEPEHMPASAVPTLERLRDRFGLAECLNRIARGFLFQEIGQIEPTDEKVQELPILDLLEGLHHRARFPILPYFYEMAAGVIHRPKEHLVLSIWHSQEHQVRIRKRDGEEVDESAVVFVLLTLNPIWHCYQNAQFIRNDKSIHLHRELSEMAYLRLTRTYDFFRFYARPVIDALFYGQLITQQLRRDSFVEHLNALSHELSKIADHIFDRSNLTVGEFLGKNTDKVLGQIKPFLRKPNNGTFDVGEIRDWRIIHSVDIFKTWNYLLQIWSGRRDQLLFDVSHIIGIRNLLDECAKLSCKMFIGEQYFIDEERPATIEQILTYRTTFKSGSEEVREKIGAYYEVSPELQFIVLLPANGDDDILWRQNALLRLLLACITNIFEHATGPYFVRLEKKENAFDSLSLFAQFLNPAAKKDVRPERPKSLGTQPVLKSCLEYLGGELIQFGPCKDPMPTLGTPDWREKIADGAQVHDPAIWETSFLIPMNKLFSHAKTQLP